MKEQLMEGPQARMVDNVLLEADEVDDLVDTLHGAAHVLGHLAAGAGTDDACCAEAGRPLDELWWDLQLAADDLENRAVTGPG